MKTGERGKETREKGERGSRNKGEIRIFLMVASLAPSERQRKR
jgi:hypothetical protein